MKTVECVECGSEAIGFWDTQISGLIPLCGDCSGDFFVPLVPLSTVKKAKVNS